MAIKPFMPTMQIMLIVHIMQIMMPTTTSMHIMPNMLIMPPRAGAPANNQA